MSRVFYIDKNKIPIPLERVYCKDEFSEQHKALEANHDLLPGDQISPDDPRRWMLIKREMPVPDPETGIDRWSIDFFFVDQDGIPTFVECKRYKDTRSRREIVAQVLEYAANGHYYWDKSIIMKYAEQTCTDLHTNLNESFLNLVKRDDLNIDVFFENVEFKLKEGNIRLIFFLEEAAMPLKSLIDFLNKQMTRTEVLLVECKMYKQDDGLVIVPSLFGYTEEARVLKQDVSSASVKAQRKKWTKESFIEHLRTQVKKKLFDAIVQFIDTISSYDVKFKYGSGCETGSLGVVFPNVCPRSVFTLWSNGSLQLQFGWINGSETATEFKNVLANQAKSIGLNVPDNIESVYPGFNSNLWVNKAESFIPLFDKFSMKVENNHHG